MKWILPVVRIVGLLAALILALFMCAGCKPKSPQVSAPPTPAAQLQETADPIAAIVSLSDPERLKTLKPEARGINGRFDKILYWLYVAEQKGIKPSRAIDQAFDQNRTTEPRRSMAKKQMESSYLQAKLWGLFTPENCDRLKRGKAGLITKGSYLGQTAEVDHIVPVSRYPQFANEIANLQLMPAMQNRSKGNRMGAAEMEKVKESQSRAHSHRWGEGGRPSASITQQVTVYLPFCYSPAPPIQNENPSIPVVRSVARCLWNRLQT